MLWKSTFIETLTEHRQEELSSGYYAPAADQHAMQAGVCADIDYLARMQSPYTTTAGEWPFYERSLAEFCDLLTDDAIVLDLGCGDGRVTLHLLEAANFRVISTDIDESNVARLARRVSSAQRERWLGYVGDARSIPFPNGSFDGCCAMGLLHLLADDAPKILNGVFDALRPEGVLIDSEALLDGALLYAVVRRNADEFLTVANESTKTSNYDDPSSERIPVLTSNQVTQLLEERNFQQLDQQFVSVLPSLIYGAWWQEADLHVDTKRAIREVVDECGSDAERLARVVISISRKTDSRN